MAGVYAGGDIVTGAATVIEAMGAGRKAARGMKAYLGLRDTDRRRTRPKPTLPGVFGIAPVEHGYSRVRVRVICATLHERCRHEPNPSAVAELRTQRRTPKRSRSP